MDARPRAVLAFDPPTLAADIFPPHLWGRLASAVRLETGVVLTETTSAAARAQLAEAEVLIAGWGAPRVPSSAVPQLRGVFYAGGVARTCLQDPEEFAARGVVAANARAANAVPVAEYTLAMILLANKGARPAAQEYRVLREKPVLRPGVGNYQRVVGIVGASQVGRLVIELLRPFDLDVIVYDPTLAEEEAERLGVQTGTLEEVAAASQVLSLHQPLTAATTGQIDARILSLLPDGATVINTARGAVLDESALLDELRRGRLDAVLDVTDPEPPGGHSELWRLPNVLLTPHIAGSMGNELQRLGLDVVLEVERFVRGEAVHYPEELI
ncbi:hydroxyacid dehydrogenase [Ruania zhangjianzhongii]|uniref:hydroxyacid dehydrogenase n=1 Tax=Ruania zhangjianzhongii TaxID=2603206 RepID=UPI0011CA49DB|nr:hydroxyacid dehydrogenase [Ruania zhangjianzhongii]